MTRRLIGGAVQVAAGVARQVIWYLSYQMEGTTREELRG